VKQDQNNKELKGRKTNRGTHLTKATVNW